MKNLILTFLQFTFSFCLISQNQVIKIKRNNGLRYGHYQEFNENGILVCDINFQTNLITKLKKHEEIISGWKIEFKEEFKEINDQAAISLGVHEYKYNFEKNFLIGVKRDDTKIWGGRNPIELDCDYTINNSLKLHISYDTNKFNQFPRIEGAIDESSSANYVIEYDTNGELKKITYHSCEDADYITSIHYFQNNALSLIEEKFGINRKIFFVDGKINRIESNKLNYTVSNLWSSEVDIINFILESTPFDGIDSESYYDYLNGAKSPFSLNNDANLLNELFKKLESESFNLKGYFESESENYFFTRTYSKNLLIDSLFTNNSLYKIINFSDSSKSIETYYSNGFPKSFVLYTEVENHNDELEYKYAIYKELYNNGMPKIIANKWMGKFEDNIIFYDNDGSEKSFSFEELENSDSLQKYRDMLIELSNDLR